MLGSIPLLPLDLWLVEATFLQTLCPLSDLGWENVNWEVFLEGTPEGKIQKTAFPRCLWNEVVKKARRDRLLVEAGRKKG